MEVCSSMIYITGDTHGNFENIKEFCYEYETTIDDIMIILGDVGINYYLNYRDDELKGELSRVPITLFCIHGNHEERPELIRNYEEKSWNEGHVYYEEEYPNILFAIDGEIYNFNEKKAITIGGAYSIDKYYRISGNLPWFSSEQPDEWIKANVEKKLDSENWEVDYVLSHTGPLKYIPTDEFLPNIEQSKVDQSTEEWLNKIEEKLNYKIWYFGHFHTDRFLDKAAILFEEILELGE